MPPSAMLRAPLSALLALAAVPSLLAADVAEGPAIMVDASVGRHRISPSIYGMAYPDQTLAKEIRLPLNRWGGDATTRYNWKVDATNAGDDWFFMAGSSQHKGPSAGPDKL